MDNFSSFTFHISNINNQYYGYQKHSLLGSLIRNVTKNWEVDLVWFWLHHSVHSNVATIKFEIMTLIKIFYLSEGTLVHNVLGLYTVNAFWRFSWWLNSFSEQNYHSLCCLLRQFNRYWLPHPNDDIDRILWSLLSINIAKGYIWWHDWTSHTGLECNSVYRAINAMMRLTSHYITDQSGFSRWDDLNKHFEWKNKMQINFLLLQYHIIFTVHTPLLNCKSSCPAKSHVTKFL